MGKRTQIRKDAHASLESKASRSRVILIVVTSIVATSVTALFFNAGNDRAHDSGQQSSVTSPARQQTALQLVDSLLVPPDLAYNTDIALLNLAPLRPACLLPTGVGLLANH